jgi:CRP/FNR family transcriptional regulator, cyclic AMP receptor protein
VFISTGGRTLTLATLTQGDFFGEMALLENLPRSASVEAINDVEVVELSHEDFMFLIQQHPEIAMKVLARFSNRLRDADHLIELLMLGDLSGQIIHRLVKQASAQYGSEQKIPREWFLPITPQDLAEQLNVSRDNVERVIRELERIGLVVWGSDGLIVKKHKKLRYYVDHLDWKTPAA